jgi:ribonuclease HIII
MLKPNNMLLNDDQTGIATYAAYSAYKVACSSILGRYLFLRRIAKVERTEYSRLDNPSAQSL